MDTGGFDALSVYEIDTVEPTPDPTPAPVTVVDPIPSGEGYATVGCSADDKNDRVRTPPSPQPPPSTCNT